MPETIIRPKGELVAKMPTNYTNLSQEQLNEEIKKGMDDLKADLTIPAKYVRENLQRKLKV
jgi:hypothetical protein